MTHPEIPRVEIRLSVTVCRGVFRWIKGSIGGVLLAVAGIVAGLLIEGGNLGQILQPTAALIVFGGTMGAVLLQFPPFTVSVCRISQPGPRFCCTAQAEMTSLFGCWSALANKARRNGVVALLTPISKLFRTRFSGRPLCWRSMEPNPPSCARSCV